jgi:hypothetical protein
MADSDTFDSIYGLLQQYPGLSGAIGMEKGMAFVRLASRLKVEILSHQGPGHNPDESPDRLPENVEKFLGNAANIPDNYVRGCWDVFRGVIWKRDADSDSVGADAELFKQYGLQNLLCELFTPVRWSTESDTRFLKLHAHYFLPPVLAQTPIAPNDTVGPSCVGRMTQGR